QSDTRSGFTAPACGLDQNRAVGGCECEPAVGEATRSPRPASSARTLIRLYAFLNLFCQRHRAMPAQTASTRPKGHAPWMKPYADPRRQAPAKARTNQGLGSSRAYETSM